MLRIFFTAIFCLSLLITGCYAPRSLAPLTKEHWPEKATAILPVTTASIQSDNPDISSEKIAKVINAVINTETKWTNNMIIGPSKLVSILGDECYLKRITEILNTPFGEIRKVQELSEFSRRFGIENIVRIHIDVYRHINKPVSSGGSSGGILGTKVSCNVEVNTELIDLNFIPLQVTNRSTGKAEYWKSKGWMVGGGYGSIAVIPFAYGKTFGRAIDQATRDSLEHLFEYESKPKDRFIEHPSGLVRDEKTGLEWFAGPDKDTTLDEAKSWVQNLSIEGGGWRLPTSREVTTLWRWGSGECCINSSLKTSGWWLWTRDPFYFAYQFSFSKGSRMVDHPNTMSGRWFAVRFRKIDSSEEAEADCNNAIETDSEGCFIALSNNRVLDSQTGLEWIFGPEKNTTWYDAEFWVDNLDTDGGGWRMPTIQEIETLYQNIAGISKMTTLSNTSGLNVWSAEDRYNKLAFSKFSLFTFRDCLKCCDSSNKARCFAVRSK